ncbi:N-acetylmuramoyl-L-alanine amidase [Achromobacter sp. NPDC058515]|uniref:N-acetylmuramoyl-L-alanine amidase n=1 Tax=Achromobacter sp. NPDC058515 TaxID=3346533 RepID=UPI0036512778
MFRLIATLLAAAVLAGCAARGPAGLDLDTSVTAVSQSSRVRYVVVHYTTVDDVRSMHLLSKGKVSSHYLVNDAGRAYRLVDENRSAWHAGAASWYGNIAMNSTSIGIEVVNPGWTEGEDGKPLWHAYNDRQVRALTILLRDIIQRHGIAPENVVGHSDIAPQRKVDPGPLFPWKTLAEAGIGRWYNEAGAAEHLARLQAEGTPDVAWFQKQLQRLGYACPQDGTLDRATINTLAAFQMHYRPALHDGQPDAETAAIMLAIL